MSEESYAEYKKQLSEPVSAKPQDVADRIHQITYGPNTRHLDIHSCGCNNLALFYLGVRESTGLFWPDENGKNKWKV